MGIPEEDRPPAWLRDYGDIEADISKMEEFAANLDSEVRENYAPHLSYLRDDVTVKIPEPAAEFPELVSFLQTHQAIQQDSTNVVFHYRDATGGFAQAAKEVSANYGQADAFAVARVNEVQSALDKTSAARAPEPGTTPPPVTDNSGVS
jgi:hypothetical protein